MNPEYFKEIYCVGSIEWKALGFNIVSWEMTYLLIFRLIFKVTSVIFSLLHLFRLSRNLVYITMLPPQ